MSKRITDVLSGLKSAASTPLGKVIGGLGLTAAAGHFGGAQGMQALGGVVDKIQQRRDLTKLQEAKDAMAGEPENMTEWKLKNTRAVEPDFEDAVNRTTGNRRSGGSGSVPGMRRTQGAGGEFVTGDDTREAFEKDRLKADAKVRDTIAELAQQKDVVDVGHGVFKQERANILQELKDRGFTGDSLGPAFQEMAHQMAGSDYQKRRKMVDEGPEALINLNDEERKARDQDIVRNYAIPVGGIVAGAKIGSFVGPLGTLIGVLIGGGLSKVLGSSALPAIDRWRDGNSSDITKDGISDDVSGAGMEEQARMIYQAAVEEGIDRNPDNEMAFQDLVDIIYEISPEAAADSQKLRLLLKSVAEQENLAITGGGEAPDNALVNMSLYSEKDYLKPQRGRSSIQSPTSLDYRQMNF